MITEKLKWIALCVAAGSLLLTAAGSVLLAGSPGQGGVSGTGPVSKGIQKQGKAARSGEVATTQPPAEEPPTARRKDVADEEREEETASKLEQLRVEAELLEIETKSERSAIENYTSRLNEMSLSLNPPGGDRKSTEDFMRQMSDQLERLRKIYSEKRLKLARMKREIARQARQAGHPVALPESAESDEPRIGDRLKALESKLDRVLEALRKSPR